jgi:glucosamine kinase
MPFTLGIDGGASATKWALLREDGTFVEGSSLPIDGHIYRSESKDRMLKVLQEIKKNIGNVKISAIYAGITGIGTESVSATEGLIGGVFSESDVTVVIDMVLGYQAHFPLGEGIFLYSGTGSIAIHMTNDGELIRSGGWGYLLGDEGGGYWIGMQAIRHALSQIDRKIPLNELSIMVMSALSAENWDEVKAFVYSQDRSAIAALAPIVMGASVQGSEAAKGILESSAKHLAGLVKQIDSLIGLPLRPVIFGGGVKEAGPLLINVIEQGIGRSVKLSDVNMARRAAELASDKLKN